MKHASRLVAVLAVFIAVASSQSLPSGITQDKVAQSPPTSPRYIFRIPDYPGTELFRSRPNLSGLNQPFVTTMEVLRTTDGRALDTEVVLAFYRDALEHNGWKEGISKREKDEPYLSMQTDVYEALADGTRIQLAGEFYLWVAPRDGMMTIVLRQWRLSSHDQASYNSVQAMVKRLTDMAPKAGYHAQEAPTDGNWKPDFEDEYLIDRLVYVLVPADAEVSMDAPPGTLMVTFLTYRDPDVAKSEKTRREHELLSRYFSVAMKGKVLVTVDGDAADEGDAAKEKRASILNAITLP